VRGSILGAATVLSASAVVGFVVVSGGLSSRPDEAASSAEETRGHFELEPPGVATGKADGAAPVASQTAEKEDAASVTSSSRSGSAPASFVIGTARGHQGHANAKRPGGSHLYSGERFRGKVPPGTPADVCDEKSSQLERSQDVADKRGSLVGQVVGASATTIWGWAYDWNDLEVIATVAVYVDSNLVATVQANASRPDFDPGNPTSPITARAWVCPSPTVLGDGNKHWIVALAYESTGDAPVALAGSPYAYGGAQKPSGQLLWVNANMAYGWVNDASSPGMPLTVSILGDGKLLGTVTTQGPAQNAAVYAQAAALAAPVKVQVPVTGLSGPEDPNVTAAVAAQAQAYAQAAHYPQLLPLSGVPSGLVYDELDFVLQAAGGATTPLPGADAAVKLWSITDGTQAFLFQPSSPITASQVQAEVTSASGAIQAELAGSPFPLAPTSNQLPFGAIATVSDILVSGWAADPDVLPGPIDVNVVIDGTFVAQIPADQPFPVLVNVTSLKDPNHGFTFVPPQKYLDGNTHTIQVFAVNQPAGANPELAGSPATFVGKRNAPPIGWLDAATVDGASGWAYDPDAGAAPVSVQIWVDGALSQTVVANQVRTDLVPIIAAEPTHGFSATLPDSVNDGKAHTVRAFALNVPDGPSQELAGSPKQINAQTPFLGIVPSVTSAGIAVASVISGSPAASAGFAPGDLIISMDGSSAQIDLTAWVAWLQTKEVGETVVFTLYRDPSLPAPPPPSPPPSPPAASTGTPSLGPNQRLAVAVLAWAGSHPH
jgi:hypothetical protein